MKIFKLIVVFFCITVSQAKADDLKAFEFFKLAEKAFSDNNLKLTKSYIEKAKAEKSNDGVVITKPVVKFVKQGRGRGATVTWHEEGDSKKYTPNALYQNVLAKEQQAFALAKNKKKRLNPPVLKISHIHVSDEDGDSYISPFEKNTLHFNVHNLGKSDATDVKITIKPLGLDAKALNLVIPIGHLAVNSMQSIEHQFTLPKGELSDLYAINLSVTEIDELGSSEHEYSMRTINYFAPVFNLQRDNHRSAKLNPLMESRQCFALENIGMATAFNVIPNLQIPIANKVQIIDNSEINQIRQLHPGESRLLCFIVKPTKQSNVGEKIELELALDYRGHDTHSLPIELTINALNHRNTELANKTLANLNNFKSLKKAVSDDGTFALIINDHESVIQYSNKDLMTNIFSNVLNIPSNRLERLKSADINAVSKSVYRLLSTSKSKRIANLHLYVEAKGIYSQYQESSVLQYNIKGAASNMLLATWLDELKELPVDNINVYLEAPFTSHKQKSTASFALPLLTELPENISLFASSAGTQNNNELEQVNSGIFTYALASGLSGDADKNHDQQVSNQELKLYLDQEVQRLSSILSPRRQVPWNKVGVNKTIATFTKGDDS